MTTDLAINLGLQAEHCDRRITMELKYETGKLKADLGNERALRAIDNESAKAREAAWKREAGELGAWNRQPWFVAILTTAIYTAAILIARYTMIEGVQ